MMWYLVGWLACCASLGGAVLAGSYSRKQAMWGWLLFFAGNVCWVVYGVSVAAAPLVVYNSFRALLSLRGANNNTIRRKQAIREQRKQE